MSDHMFDWRQDNHYTQPEEIDVNQNASNSYVAALTTGVGLHDEFIYSMTFDEYKNFPDPFPRRDFSVREVEARIQRYPNPEQPKELFQWDIHGRLLEPTKAAIPGIAVVMIHGGAVNEYEFIFTPDGPEKYLDLTRVPTTESRVGVAQHMASLGIPVLAVSLPGHYSRNPWPPIPERRPEFVIGDIPGDEELKNRLAVYTFRMCIEALKVLIEKSLPDLKLFCWGHSTGGEYFYLLEQYGLKNQLIGGFGVRHRYARLDTQTMGSGLCKKNSRRAGRPIPQSNRLEPTLAAGIRQERLRRTQSALGQSRALVRIGKSSSPAIQTLLAGYRAQRSRCFAAGDSSDLRLAR